MIKDIIKTLLAVLIALTGVRCTADEDLEGVNPQITLSTYTLDFDKGDDIQSFTIECSGSWTIIPSEQNDWLELSTASGSGDMEVEVTAKENLTVEEREITLIVSSGSTSEVIIVTQKMGDETLSIEESSPYAVAKGSDTFNINIVSNSSWSATTVDSWVKLSQSIGTGNETITIEVDENTTIADREAEISFKANYGAECTFKIEQSKGDAYITLGSLADYTYSGGTKYLRVDTNTSWEILDTANIPSWLTLGQTSGNGYTELSVKVDSHTERTTNEYTLSFDINDDNTADATCDIYQEKAPLLLVADPTEINFLSGESSENITITKNDEDTWSVVIPENAQSWLSYSDKVDGGFKLTATSNDGSERSATVTVKYDDDENASTYAEIKVTQNSAAQDKELTVDISSVAFDSDGVTTNGTIEVTAYQAWSASKTEDADWLTIETDGTDAAGTITLTATANEFQTTSRTATVTVTLVSDSNTKQTITVTQDGIADYYISTVEYEKGDTIVVDPDSPEEVSLTVKSNIGEQWRIITWDSWINATTTYYDTGGSYDYSFTPTANLTRTAQTGTLYFQYYNETWSGGELYNLKFSQDAGAATLSASGDTEFSAAGGTGSLTLSGNVGWSASVTSGSDWLTIDGDTSGTCSASSYISSNNTISLEVEEWSGTDAPRTATITLTSSDLSAPVEVTITQNEVKVEPAEFTITMVDSNNLTLNVSNTAFTSGQQFNTSDFTLSYTNTYNGADMDGEIAISSMSLGDTNNILNIVLSESIYNTDELKFWKSGVTSTITLANAAEFEPEEPAEANVETTLFVFAEDFETEITYTTETSSEKWIAGNGSYSTIFESNLYCDNPSATGDNTSSKVFYVNGTATPLFIGSETFDVSSIPVGTVLTLKYDSYVPTGSTIKSDSMQPIFLTGSNTYFADSWLDYSQYLGFTTTDTWVTISQDYTVETASTAENMRLVIRMASYTGEIYFDNFSLDNIEERPTPANDTSGNVEGTTQNGSGFGN